MKNSDFLQQLRDRNPAAVRHLTELYLPSVWRFVFARVRGDRHLAEDVVAETTLALMRAAEAGTAIDNPAGWLRTVAANKITDHFRAAARVQHLVEGNDASADDVEPIQEQLLRERRQQVRDAMDHLPEPHRLALEWKYIDKLSVREIAERLETTEKAAESILFRARREFRTRMGAELHDDDVPASPPVTSKFSLPKSKTHDPCCAASQTVAEPAGPGRPPDDPSPPDSESPPSRVQVPLDSEQVSS